VDLIAPPDLRTGIALPAEVTGVVDLMIAGRRVWSFNAARDAEPNGFVAWPAVLADRLRGRVEWQLRDHASGTVLLRGTDLLDGPDEPFELVDARGHPLAVDKAGHLTQMFDESGRDERGAIVDAVVEVLTELREAGQAEVFLAFGCLLGAVRDGRMIGHDNDADLAVLCPAHAPVDVILQSFHLQRVMERRGRRTRRMSSADFKIYVDGPGGSQLGVDLFSAWHDPDADVFTLLPNVRGPLPPERLLPPATVRLEGRDVLAPRDPVALLALTYGDGWAVPDPSFAYEVATPVRRRVNAWFRGERHLLDEWNQRYAGPAGSELPSEPSDFADWVQPQLTPQLPLLDLGCGHGRDTVWFARQGVAVTGLDYSPEALKRTREAAAGAQVTVRLDRLNFQDHRDVLSTGARLAFERQPRDLYCRLLLELLSDTNRAMFWRFCSMVQRRGGRTFVEVRLGGGRTEMDRLVDGIRAAGGAVEHASADHGRAVRGDEDPLVARLVATWTRAEGQQ